MPEQDTTVLSRPSSLSDDPNFSLLKSDDEYAQYFNLLSTMFRWLLRCYPKDMAQSYEVGVIQRFMQKLLFTVEMLRVKYTYRPTQSRSLWVDVVDSGFPNAEEIHGVVQDILGKQDRLRVLPPKPLLKRLLIDALLRSQEEPKDVLRQLSEREYLEMLDENSMFLPFVPGDLTRVADKEKSRTYVFSWGCYDISTNRPYIHIMTFDQDAAFPPLESQEANYHSFLDVIRSEGSRAPDVGILAMNIDAALDGIHPKILKRLCVGPFYSPLVLDHCENGHDDALQTAFRSVIGAYSRSPHDFVLFVRDEIIFSKDQKVTRSLLAPLGKIRQIFAITEEDPECYARHASVINRYVVMPHWILQNMHSDVARTIPEFAKARKITYDDQGGVIIHGIS